MNAAVEHATRFFSLIHQGTGWRCLFTLPDRRHHWFSDAASMAQAALRLDAAGKAVFHSCATFQTKKREATNVREFAALWLDIDAGIGKPYPTAADAYRAFEGWRQAVDLPPAVVVASGGGLHTYWTLRDPLGRERWLGAAHQLRALAVQHGLQIDPGSTIDPARILRPPGTHNRKQLDPATGKKLADVGGPARPVMWGGQTGPYDRQTLAVLLGSVPAAGIPTTPLGPAPDYLRATGESLPELPSVEAPSDPHLLAQHCRQVARLREAAGDLPEPEWYAVLGVLAHGGPAARQAAHDWSKGDPRYTYADTEKKLEQALRVGPSTCARFDSLHPGICGPCPHWGRVGSPIQLGRATTPASTLAPAPPVFALPVVPHPFAFRNMKLVLERKPTEDDPSQYHVIAEYPVHIDELQETERSGSISAVFRSWEPMERSWREFSLNLGEVFGMSGRSKLADRGVVIDKKRWDRFAEFVTVSTNTHRGTKNYGIRYEQFGWKETSGSVPGFVLGDVLMRAGEPPLRIHGTDEVDRRAALMAPQGSLAAWSAAANHLIAPAAMDGHRFMLLCAFAAPLYHFTGEPGCTFIHGCSLAPGNGKTTILEAGNSIYGMPDATGINVRDTQVAKFISMGVLANLPVVFDELRFEDVDEAKNYVLLATLGRDKQRGRPEGGLRSDHLPWSTLHISAANISLIDTVRTDGSEVAQAARIFEFVLALPPGLKTTDGAAPKQQLRDNRGTAGRAFIQAVLDNYAWVTQAVPARMRHYEARLGAGPEARFVIRLFACVDVASALVRRYGILAFDSSRMMDWAVEVQKGNAARLAVDATPDAGAILGRLINDFWPNTLVMSGMPPANAAPTTYYEASHEPRGELLARYDRDTGEMLFSIEAVRRWMHRNHYPMTQLLKQMVDEKIVTNLRTRRTLGAGWRKASGQTYCISVDGRHPAVAELVREADTPPADNVVALRR